ncbi:MAG: hypothetical protein NWE81_04355 [Candidatus Bathyarchaeota archaeon]|nr:hypothetical protein [Candidatus Bathyarchaeota archaeon]
MDRFKSENAPLLTVRSMGPRFLTALAKTAIVYIVFAVLSTAMAPVQSIYSYQSIFTAFFAAYLFFIFVIEITRGTIYQHVFCIANSLIVVVYFSYLLNTSVINFAVEQVTLMIDLRFFFYVLLLGGVVGFAKSVLQLLSWINEREEHWLSCQVKSL